MFTIPNLPAGAQVVEGTALNDFLSNSGDRGHRWFIGDEVEIPADTSVYAIIRDKKAADPKPVAYIAVKVNGNPRLLPFSAFRTFPRDAQDFVDGSNSPIMRELLNGNDADRFTLLKGKTLKVKDLQEWETRDWHRCPSGFEGDIIYKKAKFAIFE